jgi:shikimate kinase
VNRRKNIVLTGFMGTGKSTVGRALAARLRRRFVDTDDLIEEKADMTITALFAERGELYFRALEQEVLAQVCTEEGIVIATGGGALVNEENAKILQESGILICLTATPEVIFSRVRGNSDRPLLHSEDPLGKIRTLLATRADAYAKADQTIDTSYLSTNAVVETICAQLPTTLRN